jgi:hypothetical protein
MVGVGLLALDVTRMGLVMSSDSQDVLLTEGRCRPLPMGGRRSKNKILCVEAESFPALVGYVGTEQIGTTDVRTWLDRFAKANARLGLAEFCHALGDELSAAWESAALDSCMWVFVAAYADGEARFWYVVNNAEGRAGMDEFGAYTGISRRFRVVDDLDGNYMPEYTERGLTKADVLDGMSFHFRNGVLFPGAFIFDGFSRVIEMIVQIGVPGFGPRAFTLERYAYVARQRMEFLKRLYSPTHGIYSPIVVPHIDGTVHVYSLAPDGTFMKNPKIRSQARKLN